MAVSVKMSSKNQIVVPKPARDALALEPGDRLAVSVQGDSIRMEKLPPDAEDRLRGALSDLEAVDGLWAELSEVEEP